MRKTQAPTNGTMSMTIRKLLPVTMAAVALPAVALAQFSDSTNFLKAIRDADGTKVEEIVKRTGANAAIVNARDQATRETALHIVTRRRDATYLAYLLALRADPNIADGSGQTPLFAAVQLGWADGIQALLARRADVDAAGPLGQTPLSRAVQNYDVAAVRLLLAAGANPNRQDSSGRSPRDIASGSARGAAILKEMQNARPGARREMQGPR